MLYPWLNNTWAHLLRYQESGRLPHALLIHAPVALGQRQLIDTFAQSLFCTNNTPGEVGCGLCAACHLFHAGNYPDYLHLQPEEGSKDIKIDAIRGLCADLAFNTQFDQHRFAVIDQADLMNKSAANCLLKTLEEPSRDTTIVLLTERVNRLPATIRSRCQHLKIDADTKQMLQWLQEQGCSEPLISLNIGNGSPIEALRLWHDKALDLRQKLFQAFCGILRGRAEPLAVSTQFSGDYPLPVIDLLTHWVMDLIRLKSTHSANFVTNPDSLNDLQDIHRQLNLKSLFGLLALLQRAKQNMHTQLNKQLELEEIMVTCWQLGQQSSANHS